MKTLEIKNGYWHTSQGVSKCIYHIVFCPKYRRKVLTLGIQKRFKQLVKSRQSDWLFKIIEMEVAEDHVHILLQCDPEIGVNNLVAKIKGYTAHCLKQEFPHLTTQLPNLWTRSRFIVSVGSNSLETVKKYIEEQKYV
mgnify:FL=1|jgi:putative transposase